MFIPPNPLGDFYIITPRQMVANAGIHEAHSILDGAIRLYRAVCFVH
jgi:hypothetical protein